MKVLLMVGALLLAGSIAPTAWAASGDEFVGNWVAIDGSGATMKVTRAGNNFLLEFRGGDTDALGPNAIGTLKDGVLTVVRAGIPFQMLLDPSTSQVVTTFFPQRLRKSP